jgi:GH24 family phage-related lysozyme (muramidase)
MSTAIDIAFSRFPTEEDFRSQPYNDRTGKPVSCRTSDQATTGNLTWLYGLNLETEGTRELGELVARWKLAKIEKELYVIEWYPALDPVRQSVLLDIAYNAGTHGLLNFHDMLSAISVKDWATAQKECHVKDLRLAKRYAQLGSLLLTGGLENGLATGGGAPTAGTA